MTEQGNQILVKNETAISLTGWECPLVREQPDGGFSASFTSLPPHSTVDLSDHRGKVLVIDRDGLVFRGDVQIKDDPTDTSYNSFRGKPRVFLDPPGSVFYLIEDSSNKPLTPAEIHKAQEDVLTCLEHGGRPPSAGGCWGWIATRLGRPADQAENVCKQLRSQLAYGRNRRSWDDLYYSRRPSLPAGLTDAGQLQAAIVNKTVGLVIYFRALGRYPGGNADFAVLKFKVRFEKGDDDDESKCGVSWMAYRNWDGSASVSGAPVERKGVAIDRVQALLLDPLHDLAGASNERSVETTVVDHQTDSDEYDTEWSSVEVLLYAPPAAAGDTGADSESKAATEAFPSDAGGEERWPLVFRLHQRALLASTYEDGQLPHKPATGSAKAALAGASSLFGIGRVEPTLEELDAPTDVDLEDFSSVYVAPIFLHEA